MNFSQKSFKKIYVENEEDMKKYYDFDDPRNKQSTQQSAYDENKLNLIAKFHDKQLKKFKEAQELEKRLYIKEQVEELEQNFNKVLDDNIKRKNEKRRLLGIAMGTEPAPKRKLLNYIDDRFTNNKELPKDREGEMRSKELKMIEKYSKKLGLKPSTKEPSLERPSYNYATLIPRPSTTARSRSASDVSA